MAGGTLTRLVYWALLALAALAPLPFGSNRPWAWAALSLVVGVLLVLWAISARGLAANRARGDPAALGVPLRRIGLTAAGFAAVVLWIFFQASPLAPEAWHHPLWRDAARALDTPLAGSISIDPAGTLTALMRLLAYAGVFWLALQLGRRAENATRMVWTVALAGVGYSVYGLVVQFGGLDTILWYERWAYNDSLTSTFVNRNSFATYAGISLIAITALIVTMMRRDAPVELFTAAGARWFIEQLTGRLGILLVMALATASALLLTHSRGGMISALVGLLVLAGALAMARGGRPVTALMTIAGIAAFGFAALMLGGDVTLERLAGTLQDGRVAGERPAAYALVIEGIADNPWLGAGYGTFEAAFPLIRDISLPGKDIYDKAHNTYLEFAFEAGLPAFAIMMAILGGLLWRCIRGVLDRRRDRLAPCVATGATALVATHALVDFSLQIPAVAVTYALLLGAGCAQSWSSRDDGTG